jgi:hypothetical protein
VEEWADSERATCSGPVTALRTCRPGGVERRVGGGDFGFGGCHCVGEGGGINGMARAWVGVGVGVGVGLGCLLKVVDHGFDGLILEIVIVRSVPLYY